MLIDATENLKQMRQAVEGDFYDNISGSMKTKSGFALAGAVIGFTYAIMNQKPITMYLILGLIFGGMAGWGTDYFMKNITEK